MHFLNHIICTFHYQFQDCVAIMISIMIEIFTTHLIGVIGGGGGGGFCFDLTLEMQKLFTLVKEL